MTKFEKVLEIVKDCGADVIYLSDGFDEEDDYPEGVIVIPTDVPGVASRVTAVYDDDTEESAEMSLFVTACPAGSDRLNQVISSGSFRKVDVE